MSAGAGIIKEIYIAVDFGTSRSGFAFCTLKDYRLRDITSLRAWEGSNEPQDKTLTQIVYDPKGKPISYGYSAPTKYLECLVDDSAKASEYTLFKFFKMDLKHNPTKKLYNNNTGKEFDLITVIGDYLKYIKEKIVEVTKRNDLNDLTRVKWCFTVPKIWSDAEKQMTKEAAQLAGIIKKTDVREDDFLFAPEPEAAAAYCLKWLEETGNAFVGEKFLIVDAGGGTVDLTSHILVKEGKVNKLKSLTTGSGDSCGSSYLDMNFISVLESIFGKDVIDKLKQEEPISFEEMMISWESKKRNIKSLKKTEYFVPDSGIVAFLEKHCDLSNIRLFKLNKIFLTSELLKKIFDPILEKVENLIIEEINQLRITQNDQSSEFDSIFIVGGFGESQVLQSMIIDKFQTNKCKVLIPETPGGAIVKGAVCLGVDPSLIASRRMRLSYGMKTYKSFQNGVHKPELKTKLRGRTGFFCSNIFDSFVDVNEEVKYDHCVTREYEVSEANQTVMYLELYTSPKKGTMYANESYCFKNGEIVIDMSGTSGLGRKIQVDMYFGKSALEITACDKTSNKNYHAQVDFNKNHFHATNSDTVQNQQALESYHFIFVNDKSGSMCDTDTTPSKTFISSRHNNRVGALYQACHAFLEERNGSGDIASCIMYDSHPSTLFVCQEVNPNLINQMMNYSAGGGTSFTAAMKAVESLLQSYYNSHSDYKVIVMFMSDGEDNATEAKNITARLANTYGITLHTIQLGGTSDNSGLKELAMVGNGTFSRSGISVDTLVDVYKEIAMHPVSQ
ncbi:hypothetical protein ABK040_012069 [Willaertia magna]